MGNDGQADGQIRAGSKAGNDQACQQHGEITGKNADARADQIDQVHKVEGTDQAESLCNIAGQQGTCRNGEGQGA